MRVWLSFFTAGLVLASTAAAQAPAPPPRTPRVLAFGVGATYWPDVHDVDPAGSPVSDDLGRFHTWGFDLELAYHARIARFGNMDLLGGADFGIFGSENSRDLDALLLPSGHIIDGTLVARGLFLTPSLRLVFAGGGAWRFFAGAGAGYYEVDFAQLFEDGFEADEFYDDGTLGGYVSLGFDRRLSIKRPRWRLRVEAKTHLVDFASPRRYAPSAGELSGPSTLLFAAAWDH